MLETFVENHPKINKIAYAALGAVTGLLSRIDSTVMESEIVSKVVNGAVTFPYHPVNTFVSTMERFIKPEDRGKLQVIREEATWDYLGTLFPNLKGGQTND